MARRSARHLKDGRQKNFARIFDQVCYRHNRWNVWSDFVVMSAIAISNTVDKSNAESREKTYLSLASKYNKAELEGLCEMLGEVVFGIDECPDQDFLGELYMALELGNKHAGQFFTPYHLCRFMAAVTSSDLKELIEKQHWVSASDCCCGAGALLLAFANECLRQDVNYQTSVLFVAQDIDMIVACMCYIQLSLLGCAGYVVVGNSITNPITSIDGRGLIPVHGENVWYTPMYFRDVWHYRRLFWQLDSIMRTPRPAAELPPKEPEPEIPALKENKAGQLTLF